MHEILDIGCGHTFRGTVNVDLYIKPTAERCDNHNKNTDTKLRNIPNLICTEATHLPFIANIFDEVVSYQVIEHLTNPHHLIMEMARVAKPNAKITIVTPHKLGNRHKWSAHKCSFTKSWFAAVLPLLNIKYKITIVYTYIPHFYMPIFKIPKDIVVKGRVMK